MRTTTKLRSDTLCVVAFLVFFCVSGSALAAAGRVVFATGSPEAVDAAGAARALKRGDDVFAGDRLVTDARSRLQVGFVDGAYISVQPGSEYQIETYDYSGTPDGTEKAVYRLLKGGVRALTGLIGDRDPEAYKVNTAVATIGIRGTGHNTRICGGDCPGQDDGLYHNTWEGTTYVTNDVDSVDVITGRGVYVEAIDKPIVFLEQASAVTAIETGSELEEESEEQAEDTRVVSAGDQRDEEGVQDIVREEEEPEPPPPPPPPPPPDPTSTVLAAQSLQVVNHHSEPNPSDPSDVVEAGGFSNGFIFLNENGEAIGALGDFEEDDDFGNDILVRSFGTIDLDALLGADDATIAAEIQAFVDGADPMIIQAFRDNPATVAEFGSAGELSFGRWSGGNVLIIDDFFGAEVLELQDFQSLHFIFGPDAMALPTSGSASYAFVGGTQSTTVSGATIGDGVTNGFISVDFGVSQAFLEMDVTHDSVDYFVSGNLIVESDGAIFDQFEGVTATTSASGSACNPNCATFIDGGFAGPDVSGTPMHIGLQYDIAETDVILGVAGFALE